MQPPTCGAALFCFISLAAGPALAGGDLLISLDYEADAALPDCPSAVEFRNRVVRHLGHDPFRDHAPHWLIVRISPKRGRVEGRVEWRDAQDRWEGERTFSSASDTCHELGRSMALAAAIQIQLFALAQPTDTAETATVKIVSAPLAAVPLTPTVPTSPPAVVAPPLEPAKTRVGLDVGVAVMRDLGGAPTNFAPRAAISIVWPSGLAARLAAIGFGQASEVGASEGIAQIQRNLLALQLVHSFRLDRRLQPFVAGGGGAQYVRVHGISAVPSLGRAHDGQAFSAVVVASGGVDFSVTKNLFVVLGAEAAVYWPDVTVQIGSTTAAHFDGASLFAYGGILARF
jgi:hypothetical protein